MANPLIRYRAHILGPVGLPGLFTQYFDAGATPGTAEGTEAGARVRAFFESIKASLVTSVSIQYDTGGDLIDPTNQTLVGSVGGATPVTTVGGSASQPLPWANQLIVRMFTAGVVNHRRVDGRHNIAGYSTGAISAGTVVPGTATALATAANLMSTLITTAITPVVWRRPSGTGAGAGYAVVAYSVPLYVGVLRSRRD
jgi:hypothetical protein